MRRHAVVIIDVFRAFTTAAYLLDRRPGAYLLTNDCSVVARLAEGQTTPLLIGKPSIASSLAYRIPNSPTRSLEEEIEGRCLLPRTTARARGILAASKADLVLVASFVNLSATAAAIQRASISSLELWPMGHEATTPSLEDNLCALMLKGAIEGKTFDLQRHLGTLRQGPGRYFFSADQSQYPEGDFRRCTEVDRFDFATQARALGDHAQPRLFPPSRGCVQSYVQKAMG